MNSLLESLASIPSPLLFAVMLAFWMSMAVIFLAIGRRVHHPEKREDSRQGVQNLIAVVASFYAFLVGFVVVQEWDNHLDAQSHVVSEAAALSHVVMDALTMPNQDAARVGDAIATYNRSLICDEMPWLVSHDQRNPLTTEALASVFVAFRGISGPVKQDSAYDAMLSSMSDAINERRAVIQSTQSRLPTELVIVLLLSSFVLLAALSLADVRHRKMHVTAVILAAAFIASGQSVIISLNRPFIGAAALSDAPLRDGLPPELIRCTNPTELSDIRQLI